MRQVWMQGAALAVLYYLAGQVGLRMAVLPEAASPVWPAAGVAIGMLAWAGPRLWPALAVSAFALELSVFGVLGAAVAAVGITLEGVIGAVLLRQLGGVEAFRSPRGVGGFLATMAVAPIFSALTGTVAVAGLGGPSSLVEVGLTWYLGDVMGGLLVAPIVMLSLARGPWIRRSRNEVLAFVATAAAVTWIGFYPWRPPSLEEVRFGLLIIGPLVWAASRFGPWPTSLATGVFALAGMWGLAAGTLQFGGSPNVVLLQLQALIGILAVLGLVLAANVEQRNRTIAALQANEIRLREAMEVVERNRKLKAAFLNKAAHEMRTPLTPLRIQASILRTDASLPESARRALDRIDRNVHRLHDLVEGLLEAASADRDVAALRPRAYAVGDLMRLAADRLHEEAVERDVHVTVEPCSARVFVDGEAFGRVLHQLLQNAIEHTPAGKQVRLHARADGRRVQVMVEDQGPGVPEADRPQLFEPFTETAAIHGRAGPGLGLYVARSLLAAMDGRLHVEDVPGGGACFVVTLPT